MPNQLAGPNYRIVGLMPVSLKNSQPGLLPNPGDRIRIYKITYNTSFTLTDGAASGPITLMSPTGPAGTPPVAPLTMDFNPPLEIADFQVTTFTAASGAEINIFAK